MTDTSIYNHNRPGLRRCQTHSPVPASRQLRSKVGKTTSDSSSSISRRRLRAAKSFDVTRPALGGFSAMLPMSLQEKLAPQLFQCNDFDDDEPDIFEKDMEVLGVTDNDVLLIISEDEAFRSLKKSLRQRGCVTNGYIKENFHFYVQHVKSVKARKQVEDDYDARSLAVCTAA